MIPELRSIVAQSMGLYFVRLLYVVIFAAPALIIGITGQALTTVGKWMENQAITIFTPCMLLIEMELKNRETLHSIISVEEIRSRAFGEHAPRSLKK
jgi:hypothetical protein